MNYLKNKREKIFINGRYNHPFTSIIAGPSGCGKSTFVKNLLENQQRFINFKNSSKFDYVFIFIGTPESQNPILTSLKTTLTPDTSVEIFDISKLYKNPAEFKLKFEQDFLKRLDDKIDKENPKHGCVIFDDLMSELSGCGILIELFTKISTHSSVSILHITQNLFFKGAGKRSTDNITLYRNTRLLVIFRSLMDVTTLSIVGQRLGSGDTRNLINLLQQIVTEHRYVIIRGDFNDDPRLRYTSDIFNFGPPYPFQRAWIKKQNLEEL